MAFIHTWKEIGFAEEITRDGSPSLMIVGPLERGESMHHSGGAWTETDYIYGDPLRKVFGQEDFPSIVSVGLGLGYNELLCAKTALLNDKPFCLQSYESIPELVSCFVAWLRDEPMAEEIKKTYDLVAQFAFADGLSLLVPAKKKLLQLLDENLWVIESALTENSIPMKASHIVLYDAFSSKTSPLLWDENFLAEFIRKFSHQDFIFTTYACRGSLKRAFQRSEVTLLIREGFHGKRNSSLGYRGGKFQF